MLYGEHDENTLFSTENTRDTGHNFWRTCSLLFFLLDPASDLRKMSWKGTVGGGGAAKGNKGMWRGGACV